MPTKSDLLATVLLTQLDAQKEDIAERTRIVTETLKSHALDVANMLLRYPGMEVENADNKYFSEFGIKYNGKSKKFV